MIKTTYYQDLTKMNTFGMKVKARCFMEYDSVADLVDIEFEELARPVLHIGGGSNLLFTDDFKGTVLHSRIDFIEIIDESQEVLVSVGAGVVFDDFCAWAANEGLWGVENLSYIPGEVGASAVQNIGAYGVEVKDVIRKVYCYDTLEEEFTSFDVDECGYGYRDSIFKNPEIKGRFIVTHVVFALSRTPQPKLDYGHLKDAVSAVDSELTPSLIRKVIIRIRKEKLPDPSVVGSAGSFFKNPVISLEHFARIESAAKAEHGPDYKVPHYIIECQCVPETPSHSVGPSPYPGVGKCPLHTNGISTPEERYTMIKVPAAWMIEQCGWKGKRSGGAAVWEKQPLVIVNYTGEAYPEEITGLEKRIIASVKAKFDIELHPEVEHV
ncbi:MAG: UDP-N-acetylmuramate dehydrogenase [Bacteroidales bacterium]|nr:UDP-N-acetylmuramate dehydrogenase [Bacteroidales bacterium]